MRRKNLLGMLLVLISFFLLACNRVTELSETIGQGIEEQDTQEYLEQIKEMYERAKETGEQVPEDVMES